jgi:hypothetical protein
VGLRFADEVCTFTNKGAPLPMGKLTAGPLLTLPFIINSNARELLKIYCIIGMQRIYTNIKISK